VKCLAADVQTDGNHRRRRCSTDDTLERLKPFGNRIKYVYQPNKGLSAARNTGIRYANGEWLLFLTLRCVASQKTEIQLAASRPAAMSFSRSLATDALPSRLAAAPHTRPLSVRDF